MMELNIITVFLTSLISLIILQPLATKFNLVYYPTERKNHIGNIPLVGRGACVFFGLLMSYFLFIEFEKFSSTILITASLILIHGAWDDFVNLKAKTKIAFQVFLSAIMIYVSDVKLESFALWCVAIPLFDFFTVIIIRIVKKHSLMIARKDHIHHFLENLGFSKKIILLLIIFSGLAILLIGILIENNFPALSFPVFLILFLFYLFIRIYNNSEKKVKRY